MPTPTINDYYEERIAGVRNIKRIFKERERRRREHLIGGKASMETLGKTGNQYDMAVANATALLLDEDLMGHEDMAEFTEIFLTYFEEVFSILKMLTDIINTQSSKTPELEKINSQIIKKLDEHDKFYKFMMEKITNKPTPTPILKETKPHEGMYE